MNAIDRHRVQFAQENALNAYTTRKLTMRLMLLCAGIGIAIATLPELNLTSTAANSTQLAERQRLSVHLNAW